ncbi:M48 family metalloprotease [Thermosulfuriphilus ammonigenes]|uniref:M48 family metalloprotease n=1 Tax=Thermosulfuriphilus ammonigenes TaxID=1936021 RepID=A0A6G7PWK6_9BACT|nr:M48 family metallopeptidase [Thermosulfuriphilus ammonigenes]MBA2847865.1 putative Zn-dependent protease [Thermosulfuriphilus ammonigenes]QIJ71936.1 M48 family metalloprotease [Thermosulfuriphilus ammonigenes]
MSRTLKITLAIFFWILSLVSPAQGILSIPEERKLGEKILEQVEARFTLVHDPVIIGYVEKVGRRVLAHVKPRYFSYRFFVVKDRTLNAFAAPGGLVFVHTGLLEVLDSEDELADVLAHEFAHVQCRHVAKRIEKLSRLNLATAAVAIAGAFFGKGQTSSMLFSTSSALATTLALRYSRADEEEADRVGYEYILASGYDPRGLISILKKMQRHRWLVSDNVPSYLLTHPGSSERLTYLESLIQNFPPQHLVAHDSFELRRVQMRVRVLSHDPYQLIARYERELVDNPQDALLHYGLGLALLKAKEYRRAIEELKLTIKLLPQREELKADLGQAFLEAGRYQEAIRILSPYTARYPLDLSARLNLAKALAEVGDFRKAIAIFEELSRRLPENTEIYYRLGWAYASLKEDGRSHFYFGRYYKTIGDNATALYHYRQAARLLPPNDPLRKEVTRILGKALRAPQPPKEGHDTSGNRRLSSGLDHRFGPTNPSGPQRPSP